MNPADPCDVQDELGRYVRYLTYHSYVQNRDIATPDYREKLDKILSIVQTAIEAYDKERANAGE